ncbi:MAG: DUF1572 family protein [Chitinophagales bacterium]
MSTEKITPGILNKFNSCLDQLIDELNGYQTEEQIWLVTDGISNSAGNLTTHLIGNLNHFIGAVLGHSGYVRQRELEFSIKDKPRVELISEIEAIKVFLPKILNQLSEEDLFSIYPFEFPKLEFKPSTFDFLMHLLWHLSYHVGQINYHRRILAN